MGKTLARLPRMHLWRSICVLTLLLSVALALSSCSPNEVQSNNLPQSSSHISEQENSVSGTNSASQNSSEPTSQNETEMNLSHDITSQTTVQQIESMPEFGDFGRLIFPVDRSISGTSTLDDLAHNGTYIWYSNLRSDVFASALNKLKTEADTGEQIFFPIYSEDEIAADPSKANTGLFFFRGEPGAPFAIVNAGGGFAYVAALHDSFPQADEISDHGLNAFALIYRTDYPYEDLAQAIEFVYDHAEELQVAKQRYSLWGGSAGARMAAMLGNSQYLTALTGRFNIPQASAVITQYTGYSTASPYDAPTYINVGTNDGIANWNTMRSRSDALQSRFGVPSEFHVYEGLSHGFGTGKGTVAEGWTNDAIAFWQSQMD